MLLRAVFGAAVAPHLNDTRWSEEGTVVSRRQRVAIPFREAPRRSRRASSASPA